MNGLIFHTAEPEAKQDNYIEFNNVDFILNVGEGRSLQKNSVRVNGDIEITTDGSTRSAGLVYLDYKIGVHGCVDSCQVSFGAGTSPGVKENISNYARWAAMGAIGTLYEDDYLNARQQVELRAPNEKCAGKLATGEVTLGTTPVTDDLDFSFKPNCILNKMSGDHLPFEKSGEIRLTLNLARNMSALMGANQGTGATYKLKKLHCQYNSVPTQGKPMSTATSMASVYNVKNTILSNTANLSVQVPATCSAVSCSFQRQDRENVNVFNNYAAETVQDIRQVQFLFNDSTNKYVSYEINDLDEMVHRYLDSFGSTGHQQMMLDKFRSNDGFGIGLSFNGLVDLSRQRFGIQLTSNIDNARPYNIYSYFHSAVVV